MHKVIMINNDGTFKGIHDLYFLAMRVASHQAFAEIWLCIYTADKFINSLAAKKSWAVEKTYNVANVSKENNARKCGTNLFLNVKLWITLKMMWNIYLNWKVKKLLNLSRNCVSTRRSCFAVSSQLFHIQYKDETETVVIPLKHHRGLRSIKLPAGKKARGIFLYVCVFT